MTNDLLQFININNDLYVDWKKNSKTLDIYNEKKTLWAFDKIVNTQIEETKRTYYYYNTFRNYKFSMKKTLANNE